MKKLFVENLQEGQEVREMFLVASKNLNYARNGKPYLALTLADRTGTIETRVWEDADRLTALFAAGDVLKISGRVSEYQGRLQISAKTLDVVSAGDADPSDYLPSSPNDIEAMWQELMALCRDMENPHLRALMELFFEDEEFVTAFKTAPAAKGIHHVYVGGLLEHTLSVAKLSKMIGGHYTAINEDMLLVSAVLHDAAKTRELSYASSFDYTDEGRLLGHIPMGIGMVEEKIAQLEDFPRETALHLKHIIASHHGVPEFGAIKTPATPEAVVFHHIDNIDAKFWTYLSAIEKDMEAPGDFTSFHPILQTFLYKGDAGGRGEGGYGYRMDQPAQDSKRPARNSEDETRVIGDPTLDLFSKGKTK